MLQELQKRNHTNFFNLLDKDSDGFLTWDDQELFLDSFTKTTGLAKASPECEHLRGAIRKNWDELLKHADSNRDGKISLAEWLAHQDRMVSTEEGYRIAVSAIADSLFQLADDDRDGKLSLANYTKLLEIYGVDGARAREAFGRVDTDHNGIVTIAELTAAVQQFMRSANPDDPGHWLLGRPS
jgi:Ca2+-binding EF-hand superfamily protein